MEWLKDSDFNINTPYALKKRMIKDANEAMDARARIDLQIVHWERIPDDNIFKMIVLDELYYLRDGKV